MASDAPDSGSTVPQSSAGIKRALAALTWARQRGLASVLVLVSGHGAEAYADPTFREVLGRGMAWLAEPN